MKHYSEATVEPTIKVQEVIMRAMVKPWESNAYHWLCDRVQPGSGDGVQLDARWNRYLRQQADRELNQR